MKTNKRREDGGCRIHREVQNLPCYKCKIVHQQAEALATQPSQDLGFAYPETDFEPSYN